MYSSRLFIHSMKKFILILSNILLLVSCGASKNLIDLTRDIKNPTEQRLVLFENYPQLYVYYTHGLMDISSMREFRLADGSRDWKLKYKLKKRYITDYSEQMNVLKANFPEVYNLYSSGRASIDNIYEYVAKDGKVNFHIEWRHVPGYF